MCEKEQYSGKDLIEMGCQEGPELGSVLRIVNARAHTPDEVMAVIEQHKPAPALAQHDTPAPCQFNITPNNDIEADQ